MNVSHESQMIQAIDMGVRIYLGFTFFWSETTGRSRLTHSHWRIVYLTFVGRRVDWCLQNGESPFSRLFAFYELTHSFGGPKLGCIDLLGFPMFYISRPGQSVLFPDSV